MEITEPLRNGLYVASISDPPGCSVHLPDGLSAGADGGDADNDDCDSDGDGADGADGAGVLFLWSPSSTFISLFVVTQ